MIRVPAIREELRGMIIARNQIASYSRNRTILPEMLQNTHACERCYAKTPCFLYHKVTSSPIESSNHKLIYSSFWKMGLQRQVVPKNISSR